jgi:uncharacterized protein YbbK (DUF523 family)
MENVLISACLLGEPVRPTGGNVLTEHKILERWKTEGRLVTVCPELAGGLFVPRPPAEILNGIGKDVLENSADVFTNTGKNVTAEFVAGANHALALAESKECKMAILTEKSPSCGSSVTYDGSFTGVLITGSGVTAALLQQNNIRVFNQHQLQEAEIYLREIETA